MRQGFGLPQVLLILLFIGGIVTVTMRYSSLGAQHYADSYTREQAELFLQSATEVALLRISAFPRTLVPGGCLQTVNVVSSDAKFNATVTIEQYYLADGTICTDSLGNLFSTSIQTDESHGMVSMNVIVTSNTHNKILHPTRLERRSLQRP